MFEIIGYITVAYLVLCFVKGFAHGVRVFRLRRMQRKVEAFDKIIAEIEQQRFDHITKDIMRGLMLHKEPK